MRAEWLLDVTLPAVLGSQLDRLEPVDVLAVKKHESDDGASLVRLEGMTGEDGALDHESIRINREERAGADELLAAVGSLLESSRVISKRMWSVTDD